MERSLIVLLDGWTLAYQSNTPGAVHLWTLLENLPACCQTILATPAPLSGELPDGIEAWIVNTPPTPGGRLIWEQRTLPVLANRVGAGLIHLTSGAPTLFGKIPNVLSPAGFDLPADYTGERPERQPPARDGGLPARIRQALLPAGIIRAGGVIWPADLPEPNLGLPTCRLQPIVPAAFANINSHDLPGSDLPESYILYHGPGGEADLRRLLDAWSWADPAIGKYYPLLAIGLDSNDRVRLGELAETYHASSTVQALPEISIAELATIYNRCSALFQTGSLSPWGDPFCMAMACAKPIVALHTPLADARLGPAAYLIQPGDSLKATSRALGAALVTVIVDESVGESLAATAKKRSAAWLAAETSFQASLSEYYCKLTGK